MLLTERANAAHAWLSPITMDFMTFYPVIMSLLNDLNYLYDCELIILSYLDRDALLFYSEGEKML